MKKLIVAAVAAAIIAPASVMAAGPTLYGKLQMSVNALDNGGSGDSSYDEVSLNSNHSRIGIKGSEDLGNGMKVGYLIEWQVDMDGDQPSSELSARNRAVTLSGDWGTALVGKWDTPMKTVGRKVELFPERLGDQRNMNTGTTLDQRADNVIAYVTPNMNGFSSTIAYVVDAAKFSDTNGADNSDGDAVSFNALYSNGPIFVGLGYVNYSSQLFGYKMEDQSSWRLAGSYAIGDFKVLGSYTDVTDANGFDGADTDIWTVGASYAMGNNTIKFQYGDRSATDTTSSRDGADQWAIGLDHAMSKRTTVYVEYADLSNERNADSVSWSQMGNSAKVGQTTTGNSTDTDGFGVGIVHKF